MLIPNKLTEKIFSIAPQADTFKAKYYASIFTERGINAVYLPYEITSDEALHPFFQALTTLGVKGVIAEGLLRHKVGQFLWARPQKKLNYDTLIQIDQRWRGLSGDESAYEDLLSTVLPLSKKAHIIGKSSNAKALKRVLSKHGIPYMSYDRENVKQLHKIKNLDVLINTDPVSGTTHRGMKWDLLAENARVVIDVVVRVKPTRLIEEAQKKNKIFFPGQLLALHQMVDQFHLFYPEQDSVLESFKELMQMDGYDF